MNDNLANLLKKIAASAPQTNLSDNLCFNDDKAPQPFSEKMEQARAKKIRNDNRESDQRMKKYSLIALFTLLATETIALFVLAFFQGFKCGGFHLEEWCFNVVIGATLLQIAYMLTIAIKHLFPTK